MNREEIAWAAGLFEGEGTVGNWKNGNGRQVVSRVVMTDRDVLERFTAAVFPVCVKLHGPHGPYGISKKLQHQAETVNFQQTQALMAMFWPWLGERRREQIRLAFRGPHQRPFTSKTHCQLGHPYTRNTQGRLHCLTCKSAYDRERYLRWKTENA